MDNETFYNSPEWHAAREHARKRDGDRCSVARLLGGNCSARLDVHHLQSVEERPDLALDVDNLITVCSHHHPTLEAAARLLRIIRLIDMPPCHHRHPYAAGRIACENKRRNDALAKRAARLGSTLIAA